MLGCAFFVYLVTLFWYTIQSRNVGYYPGRFELFWSYKLWFGGSRSNGVQILANIAMFVPLGFLMAVKWQDRSWETYLLVVLVSLVVSAAIETAQFTLMRGTFEFDDLCSNIAGAVLGATVYRLFQQIFPDRFAASALYSACFGIVIFCIAVFLRTACGSNGSVSPLSQGFCFQVEGAAVEEDRLRLSGVGFWYGQGPTGYTLVLKSAETGKQVRLETRCGILYPDAADYFHREDLKAGFEAVGEGIRTGEEYEIMLDFGLFRRVSTGIYLTVQPSADGDSDADIHYTPDAVFRPVDCGGTALEEIAVKGVLRLFSPEQHVYVYWYDGKLYWIAEDGFNFEADGSTRLEMILYTTETEKLSQKSRDAGNLYDTYGVYFEKNELKGDFGRYRVCAREVPEDYIITSIKTGYYQGGWVWQASFWPVFDFAR